MSFSYADPVAEHHLRGGVPDFLKKRQVIYVGYIYTKPGCPWKLLNSGIGVVKIIGNLLLNLPLAAFVKIIEVYSREIRSTQSNKVGIEITKEIDFLECSAESHG